jgi:hypothetical protein
MFYDNHVIKDNNDNDDGSFFVLLYLLILWVDSMLEKEINHAFKTLRGFLVQSQVPIRSKAHTYLKYFLRLNF